MKFSRQLSTVLLILLTISAVACDRDDAEAPGEEAPSPDSEAQAEEEITGPVDVEALMALLPDSLEGWERSADPGSSISDDAEVRTARNMFVHADYEATSEDESRAATVVIQCHEDRGDFLKELVEHPVGHVEESERMEGLRDEWIEVGDYRGMERRSTVMGRGRQSEVYVYLDAECSITVTIAGGEAPQLRAIEMAERLPLSRFDEARVSQ